ncbi:MAG: hypothetical protein EZS28_009969 [Streblomastix strix]|uniref:Uncharacterized protein n=1 Tax=Streblomastix strix TaxID=222440 RepID=A0A5J4WIG8_9EUKA|nr:MAG: hypothetical protein EZS28_009969 [Streblomastix strix]
MITASTPELRSEIDSKVKVITLTKTPRKYTRKNKTNDKAKELVDQMFKEQENEVKNDETKCIISGIVNELLDASLVKETINETTNETINETISEPQIEVKNNLFTDEEFEKMIDDAVKNDPNSKTIRERTLGAIFDAHNYKKCSKGNFITDSDKVTGKLLDINQMEDDYS